MKKKVYIAISLLILLASCGEQKEHRYMVISNNYADTLYVWARYWQTCRDSLVLPDGVYSVTEFTSGNGVSLIYNVDCIIAMDSIDNK